MTRHSHTTDVYVKLFMLRDVRAGRTDGGGLAAGPGFLTAGDADGSQWLSSSSKLYFSPLFELVDLRLSRLTLGSQDPSSPNLLLRPNPDPLG